MNSSHAVAVVDTCGGVALSRSVPEMRRFYFDTLSKKHNVIAGATIKLGALPLHRLFLFLVLFLAFFLLFFVLFFGLFFATPFIACPSFACPFSARLPSRSAPWAYFGEDLACSLGDLSPKNTTVATPARPTAPIP